MKPLLVLFSVFLLSGCTATGQFWDEMFGANTKKTVKWCNDEGECTKVVIDGDQSDMTQMVSVLAQLYGLEVTIDEE